MFLSSLLLDGWVHCVPQFLVAPFEGGSAGGRGREHGRPAVGAGGEAGGQAHQPPASPSSPSHSAARDPGASCLEEAP